MRASEPLAQWSRGEAGERYGVIWAEEGSPAGAKGNIKIVNRVGIRMYLDIGPEAESNFQIDKLTPARSADGQPRVMAQVHNTGGRALDMGGKLSISDGPGGLSAGPFPVVMGTTLLPGDTAPVTAFLDKHLPDGPWKVRLSLSSGLIEREALATLTFPPPDHVGPPVAPDRTGWRPALSAGLGVALVPVAGFGVWYLRRQARRRRSETAGRECPEASYLRALPAKNR